MGARTVTISMAYCLLHTSSNDAKLIAKANRWVNWTLQSQNAEGQFEPAKNNDWWPRMVMLKVLTQYEEATGDSRVIPFMTKYFEYERRTIARATAARLGQMPVAG